MNKEVRQIFGTALFGVVTDLAKAKESGVKLPGVLDNVAELALKAKETGVDIVKEEAKHQALKYLPWAIAALAVIVVIVVLLKKEK